MILLSSFSRREKVSNGVRIITFTSRYKRQAKPPQLSPQTYASTLQTPFGSSPKHLPATNFKESNKVDELTRARVNASTYPSILRGLCSKDAEPLRDKASSL